jgi:fructan beta-fructosidase
LRPAIHVGPPSGWLNDPNGLCFHDGVWHAFYQHDPGTDVHRSMHWGHATSRDLLRWNDLPIALAPDHVGTIYSGSVVVDHDNSAGFGHGAMVAAFTHHLDGLERQSLAFSTDRGLTWQKFAGNPVLESGERDFRDPKLLRHVVGGVAAWAMALAVGQRIEFYRSVDLRQWELAGSFTMHGLGPDLADEMGTVGAWECPDLIRLGADDDPNGWLLVFSAVGVGPHLHGGTIGVLGVFDGFTFHAAAPPVLLDHGPDFYAAQSFWGAPHGAAIVMGWLNSWRYAIHHPSAGRRGLLSLPRRLGLVHHATAATIRSRPAVDLASCGVHLDRRTWDSEPGRAVHIGAVGDVEVTLSATSGDVAIVRISGGIVTLHRLEDVVGDYAQTYSSPVLGEGPNEIVVDHGTLEVFAGDGATSMSALVFAGPQWTVEVDGEARLTVI